MSAASQIKDCDAGEIAARYRQHGYALVNVDANHRGPDGLLLLAKSLNLGSPFVPPLYNAGRYSAHAVSQITAIANSEGAHPSFERTVAVNLHCDGTLQTIGVVKTSILLCERPAFEGGDTILFNSSGAYAELVAIDKTAAAALATPGVLIRQANLNACNQINSGPAFSAENGRLVCSYCVSDTDRWERPPGVDAADLERALTFFEKAASPTSRYFTQIRLAAGDAIILSNTRISHGRNSYRDTASLVRCYYRALFLSEPVMT